LWLHSLKVAQLLRSAACLHTNQSRSYLNHLVYVEGVLMSSKRKVEELYLRNNSFIVFCYRLHVSTYLLVIFRSFDKIIY